MEFILAVIAVCVYFLPTLVAAMRNHSNLAAIAILNLLAGWTLVGWVGALVWSATAQTPRSD